MRSHPNHNHQSGSYGAGSWSELFAVYAASLTFLSQHDPAHRHRLLVRDAHRVVDKRLREVRSHTVHTHSLHHCVLSMSPDALLLLLAGKRNAVLDLRGER